MMGECGWLANKPFWYDIKSRVVLIFLLPQSLAGSDALQLSFIPQNLLGVVLGAVLSLCKSPSRSGVIVAWLWRGDGQRAKLICTSQHSDEINSSSYTTTFPSDLPRGPR
jgi:hypothetical protein